MLVERVSTGLPSRLQINGFAGEPGAGGSFGASGAVLPAAMRWILKSGPPQVQTFLRPGSPADPRDWRDERVGYGVILPDRDDLSDEARRSGSDAPEPIYALIAERNAPVFRFRETELGFRYLRDYVHMCDVSIASAPTGTGKGYLPRYLLLCGGPDVLPWSLQYVLNAKRCPGRLHLTGDALERYVTALRHEWSDAGADPRASVVWATSHDEEDITHLISQVIAEPLAAKYARDTDMPGHAEFFGADATHEHLLPALAGGKPAMIVTASHGRTWPLDDPAALATVMGLPVDAALRSLDVDALLASWQPDGAVWYAHACCSAGSDSQSAFANLVEKGSDLDAVLRGVAATGSTVAPLPTALLSARKPARAFVGHVEPTFDWSVRDPGSGQTFSDDITKAFYERLFLGHPLGLALRPHYGRIAGLFSLYDNEVRQFNRGEDTLGGLLGAVLVARDIQSMVILGDPTVALVQPDPGPWTG